MHVARITITLSSEGNETPHPLLPLALDNDVFNFLTFGFIFLSDGVSVNSIKV